MIEIVIPGYKTLDLQYLVMDYNGTLAGTACVVTVLEEARQVEAKGEYVKKLVAALRQ